MTEKPSETLFKRILYRPAEVAELLSVSEDEVSELVKDGKLIAHCPNGAGKKPMRVTAESIRKYCIKHLVPPEKWAE